MGVLHKLYNHLQHLGRNGLVDGKVFFRRTRRAMLEEMVLVGQPLNKIPNPVNQ